MNASKSLLFTLSLILLSHAATSSINLYESVCKDAGEDSEKCLVFLKDDPKILAARSYKKLAKVILEMGLKKGVEGQNFLKELAKSNPNSKAIAQCANELYDGVVGSFKSSLGELEQDALTASYDAKVASDGPTTCDRALAAENINNPSIANLNKDVLFLSSLSFFAVSKLPVP
ncbi:hypothetical protein HN51_071809 [Arachis hypogaea]|uniref:Pectinesterase inhibitor domain-containing protein n=1 Tax=Arachis hypogaea TaxID=3818 RepID=A0A444YX53_ARAHY|nr:uncharacterized protein LOC107642243 [Arachis ipaensis]XP_025657064.1 uncharacterized protein LOC112751944 [Arachis hypogaea]QHO14443.1 uncharacterized protein DS421_15g524250 [Arachis hypogaea]RYR06476.1 hypothetical protein Ahy_B05g073813 [Arachis hypogaea]